MGAQGSWRAAQEAYAAFNRGGVQDAMRNIDESIANRAFAALALP
jgi:hypothetical protein